MHPEGVKHNLNNYAAYLLEQPSCDVLKYCVGRQLTRAWNNKWVANHLWIQLMSSPDSQNARLLLCWGIRCLFLQIRGRMRQLEWLWEKNNRSFYTTPPPIPIACTACSGHAQWNLALNACVLLLSVSLILAPAECPSLPLPLPFSLSLPPPPSISSPLTAH